MTAHDRSARMFRVSRRAKAINNIRGDLSDSYVTGVWGFEIWEGWR